MTKTLNCRDDLPERRPSFSIGNRKPDGHGEVVGIAAGGVGGGAAEAPGAAVAAGAERGGILDAERLGKDAPAGRIE